MSTATGVPAAAATRHRGPAGWPRWAVILLAVLAWIAALAAIWPLVRGYLTSVPDQRMVDLNVYRTSGLSVLQGQPLYTVLTPPPQLLPFTYPPAAALFAVPLALLPWSAAQLAWVPFVYVPLAVIIWFAFAPLLRRVSPVPLRAAAFAVLFATASYLFPMRDEMRFGQVDTVLLALAVADCAARSPRWPGRSAPGCCCRVTRSPTGRARSSSPGGSAPTREPPTSRCAAPCSGSSCLARLPARCGPRWPCWRPWPASR